MVVVEICIGSSCYVKGSSEVVNELNQLIKDNGWTEKVDLKGSFCMNACQEKIGLGIKVNGKRISGITIQNAAEVLKKELEAALA